MKIDIDQLPCDEAEFIAKLDAYRQARMDAVDGEPAPFPEFEIMRVIVDRGEELEITRDSLQDQAKEAGRDALAELDALKSVVMALKKKVDSL